MEKFQIIPKNEENNLPKTAGVYCFIENKEIIYIGKAINIKDRVKNHFQQPSYKDNLFIEKVGQIGFINTDSEIEALILEANLIKKYQPKFNIVWRDDKNYFYVAITKGQKPTVFITHQPTKVSSIKYKVLSTEQKNIHNTKYPILNTQYIGPFVEGEALKKTLKFLRKIFPYYTTQSHPKNKCTWCHLDLCPGPNPNLNEYQKNIKKLTLILQGKRKIVLNSLKKEMQDFSKKGHFEGAGIVRDKIFALERVMLHKNVINQDKIVNNEWQKTEKILQEILNPVRGQGDYGKIQKKQTSNGVNMKNPISRIECYDISNIQGEYATGSMVVFVNGKPNRSLYKKFRIRMENKPNDIAMLSEVLKRRLAHPEWLYPEVMLIDGGIAQLNIGIKTKNQEPNSKNIKVISIAKGKRELLIEGQKKHISLKNLPQEIYNVIVALDDEAHRFAITYHRKLMKKNLLM